MASAASSRAVRSRRGKGASALRSQRRKSVTKKGQRSRGVRRAGQAAVRARAASTAKGGAGQKGSRAPRAARSRKKSPAQPQRSLPAMLGSEGALREASSKREGKAMVGLNAGLGAAHNSELSKSYAREHS